MNSESLAKHSEGIKLLLQHDFASKAHIYGSEDSLPTSAGAILGRVF